MDTSEHESLERIGDGWSYRMEHMTDPPHVLVTLSGTAQSATIEAYYEDIVIIMNRIVGAGIRFLPIIFDASNVEVGQINLPVIWKSPGQVPRRVSKIIVIISPERGGLIGGFVRTLAGMFPGMSIASTLEDARSKLNT